jgi:hypothetical protein
MADTYILGDVHGHFGVIYGWLEDHAKAGDTLIQVGDFGAGFVKDWLLDDLGFEAKKKGALIKVIRGNHDSPYPFAKGGVYGDNLELIQDYTTQVINGKKYLFIGGALSIDRTWRKEGEDYWKDEVVDYDLSKLDGIEGVDVLITHTCPDFLSPAPKSFSNIQWALDRDLPLKDELIFERDYMTQVWNKLKENNDIKEWYGGHFHVSLLHIIGKTKFRFLGINELIMIN